MNASHENWKYLISQYIDGELSPEEKDTLTDHLVDCPACQKYLKELQTLSGSIKSLNDLSLSPDLEQRLTQLNAQKERSDMDRKSFWSVAKTLVPVLVITVMVGLSLQTYVKKGQHGRLRSAADDISDQFGAENTKAYQRTRQIALSRERDKEAVSKIPNTSQYEAYYQASPYNIDQRPTAELAPASMPPQENQISIANRIQPIIDISNEFWATDSSVSYQPVQGPYKQSPGQGGFNREQYDVITENEFLNVSDNPLSTFSIDVDTASYANIRRFLNNHQLPPRDAVRIEEMINYFQYNYPRPQNNEPFLIILEHGPSPWNANNELVLIGLQGKNLDAQQTPASNLVFLIDVSGSMASADRLPLIKESLKRMVTHLRPQERVSIVVYSGTAGLVLDSARGDQKALILSAIDNLYAGGSTAGGQGIKLAYEIAKRNFIPNGNNRVILATDGDFNVGVSSDSELVQLIEEKRKSGVFLTLLGVGTGNLQDAKMKKLASSGNGQYFYIDSLKEAEKVLIHEMGSTLFTIAKDVKIQVEFNPQHVKAYRLIGYENRILAKEDFNDDRKDAGEMGAGHSVTALYELIPAGSLATTGTSVDELKYQQPAKPRWFGRSKEVMTVKIRYKDPRSEKSQLATCVLPTTTKPTGRRWGSVLANTDNFKFASAVAEFGMLLRQSKHSAHSSYHAVLQRAQMSFGYDPHGTRAEFLDLVRRAQQLDQRTAPVAHEYSPHVEYPVMNQGGYPQK